ncbi:hypothetical protein M569_10844, partial [Genlisea aurea]
GQQIHCNAFKTAAVDSSDPTVSNSLLAMYSKHRDTPSAVKLFDEMPHRDSVSWSSMINCYSRSGLSRKAMHTFTQMYSRGFAPTPELMAACLSACRKDENSKFGRAIHGLVFVDERVEDCSSFLASSLVDFYCKAHDLSTACCVFDRIPEKNVASWTAMICGWIQYGDHIRAIECLKAMQRENTEPNVVTLISVLPAVAPGKEIHAYAIRRGCDSDPRLSSALLHVYCSCGGVRNLHVARLIFDRSAKEITMWSSMIAGYSKSKGQARKSIKLFNRMQTEGIRPNNVTMLGLISACSNLISLSDGHGVHGHSMKSGLISHLPVQNAMIDMYAKCGSLSESEKVFHGISNRDCISWSALINAYGLYGCAEKALKCFYELLGSEIEPDGVAYLAALSACNHGGMEDEGKAIFELARKDGGTLSSEHYACYVDLLGRAGKLEDAYSVVCSMPMRPSPRILTSLASACKLHGRLNLAEALAGILINDEPEKAATHKLVSMIYAESGNWPKVEEIRR